jgi:hypothetical protein
MFGSAGGLEGSCRSLVSSPVEAGIPDMLKYFLLFAVLWLLWRLFAPAARPRRGRTPPPEQAIRACAHCGVYLPESDLLRADDGALYCCAEHLRAGRSA